MSPEPPNYTLKMPFLRRKNHQNILFTLSLAGLILGLIVLLNNARYQLPYYTEEVAAAESEQPKTDFDQTKRELSQLPGDYSLYVKDLATNTEYTYNENNTFYAASLYKFPLAIAALKEVEKGKYTLNTDLTIMPYDFTSGTGVLTFLQSGTKVPLRLVLDTLMRDSDNVSQNVILRSINYETKKDSFNLNKQTLFLDQNIASPKEISGIFQAFYDSDYLNLENKAYLLEMLSRTSFDDRISPYLAPGLIFAHKIGSWQSSYHDCGLIFGGQKTLSVCLMSKNTNLENFKDASNIVAKFINGIEYYYE